MRDIEFVCLYDQNR